MGTLNYNLQPQPPSRCTCTPERRAQAHIVPLLGGRWKWVCIYCGSFLEEESLTPSPEPATIEGKSDNEKTEAL